MPTPAVRLELADAAELVEGLTSISQWLAGPDRDQLASAFARFIGTDGYSLADLRADLARFTFLLGVDDGEDLFGHGNS